MSGKCAVPCKPAGAACTLADDCCSKVCSNGQCGASSGPTGCHGLIWCLRQCAGDRTCRAACRANTTTQGLNLYNAIDSCDVNTCVAMMQCTSASDLSLTCSQCLQSVESTSCKMQVDAGVTDLP
jgi:hypothetical protein